MVIINPSVCRKSFPTFSHAFDAVLSLAVQSHRHVFGVSSALPHGFFFFVLRSDIFTFCERGLCK
jgi:hypothetical protein